MLKMLSPIWLKITLLVSHPPFFVVFSNLLDLKNGNMLGVALIGVGSHGYYNGRSPIFPQASIGFGTKLLPAKDPIRAEIKNIYGKT